MPTVEMVNSAGTAGRNRKQVVAGLFAGIGGLEIGLARSGHRTAVLCELDPHAQAVLSTQFSGMPLVSDVRELDVLPSEITMLCAGFPCQDLSSSGQKSGIGGNRSSLVGEVFRLLEKKNVEWVLFENVKFMLHLNGGSAMNFIISRLEDLGFKWAYRVVNTQWFGLPQRRHRVFLLASRHHDPRKVLLADDAGLVEIPRPTTDNAIGFYWTEGTYATGLASRAVPPLKGGSTIGIPSPPAILLPNGDLITPDIRDAERLQGFDADWTLASDAVSRRSQRWKLVGNAVSVNVAEWIGKRLVEPGRYDPTCDVRLSNKWPHAAWGDPNVGRFGSSVSERPLEVEMPDIQEFLQFKGKPLSEKAVAGFVKRARAGNLSFPDGFIDIVSSKLR